MSWLDCESSPLASRATPAVALTGLALTFALGLAGCASIDQGTRRVADTLTLYKPEVVQGNFVSREQAAQLRTGMTRLQVRDLLGTPLVTPLFEGDRWDYVFTMDRQGVPQQNYRLTLYFTGDTLGRVDGGKNLPSEKMFVQRISGHTRTEKAPPLRATPEQLKAFAAANPAPAASVARAAASAIAPDKTYPPLE